MKTAVQRKSKSYYIANELMQRLKNGDLADNSQLPSAREIAEEFSVAVRTADAALRLLAADGKVVRKIGSGTFAGCSALEEITRFFREVLHIRACEVTHD